MEKQGSRPSQSHSSQPLPPRYILYLVPTQGTPLHVTTSQYFEIIKNLPGNKALQYPPHITLTSFFSQEAVGAVLQLIENQGKNLDLPLFAGLSASYEFIGLGYIEQIRLKNFLDKVHQIPGVSRKSGLHLSLAYGNMAPKHMETALHQTYILQGYHINHWDLVLYETDQNHTYWKKIVSYTL